MANTFFTESKWGKRLAGAVGRSKLTLATLGESHGTYLYVGEAIGYALQRYYPADIIYDYRTYDPEEPAEGGQSFAVGATTIDEDTPGQEGLQSQVTNWFPNRPADICIVMAGWNDCELADSAATILGRLTAAIDDLFAQGALHVIVGGIGPSGGAAGAGGTIKRELLNILIRDYCRATPYVHFWDVYSVLGGGNDSSNPRLFATPTNRWLTSDNTHWSALGGREMAPSLAAIFQNIGLPLRSPRRLAPLGAYDPVNRPYTNMLGDLGAMLGTSGIGPGGGFDGTTAGTGATSRLEVTDTGGLTAATSIITDAKGIRKQRFTMSGSGDGNLLQVTFRNGISAADGGVAGRFMELEMSVDLTAMVGLTALYVSANGHNSPTRISQNSNDAELHGARTETLLLRTTYPIPVPAGSLDYGISLTAAFGGASPSGTLDVYNATAALVEE